MGACANAGRTSAPRLPQAVQTKVRLDIRQPHVIRPAIGGHAQSLAVVGRAAFDLDHAVWRGQPRLLALTAANPCKA